MNLSEIERFTTDLKSDAILRAEAEKAQVNISCDTPLARAVAFAATKGYAFTTDEAKKHAKAISKVNGKEFTDAELDSVAGGSCLVFYFAGGSCLTCFGASGNSCLVALPGTELDSVVEEP